MGREIKRVPLGFDWPLGKVWEGFVNPLYAARQCERCDGSGSSDTALFLGDRWYGNSPFRPEERGSSPFTPTDEVIRSLAERHTSNMRTGAGAVQREAERLCAFFNKQWSHHLNQNDVDALVKAGRLYDFTHDWSRETGWTEKAPPYRPTAREVNEWSVIGLGHDSINKWVVVEAECERLGLPSRCRACGGRGEIWPSEEAREAYEAWGRVGPPVGDGWQLWETVTEGSPISPVFSTEEEMVWFLVTSEGYAENAARAFTKAGWAPSAVITSEHGVVSGIAALGVMAEG